MGEIGGAVSSITKTVTAKSKEELDSRIQEVSKGRRIINVSHSTFRDGDGLGYSAVVVMEAGRMPLVEG